MKRYVSAILALACAVTAAAEGYQVNNFSARQEGMGHTGTAMILGAESNIFNPGAVAFSGTTFEAAGGISAIIPSATATYGGHEYTTDNKVSTPMNVSASFRIFDDFYGGLSFYTPYGSSINWGENWPGAVLNQSVDLKVFTIQPTLSYRVLPNLSFGAGLMISWGSVNLDKGLVSDQSFNTVLRAMGMGAAALDGITPASANLNGSSRIALGYNVGVLWKVCDKVNLGLSYRSKMNMKVTKGVATVSYANETSRAVLGEALDNLNSTNFSASMPCPWVLTLGVAYKPIEALTVATDIQLNGWKAYRSLDIEFDHLEAFDQHLTKNYHNSLTYHLGAEYNLTRRFDIRAGLMVDCSPADKQHYNPETPAQTRIEPTVGFSFRPIPALSIDFAMMYVHGCGVKNATGHYEDFIAARYPQFGMPADATFTADYRLHAFSPGIGLSYRF